MTDAPDYAGVLERAAVRAHVLRGSVHSIDPHYTNCRVPFDECTNAPCVTLKEAAARYREEAGKVVAWFCIGQDESDQSRHRVTLSLEIMESNRRLGDTIVPLYAVPVGATLDIAEEVAHAYGRGIDIAIEKRKAKLAALREAWGPFKSAVNPAYRHLAAAIEDVLKEEE